MYNNLAPEYLSSLIPQQVNNIARYKLRNSNNIHTIRAKTKQYNNSLLPSVLRDWNTLPAAAKQLNTLSALNYFFKERKQACSKIEQLWKMNYSNTTYPTTNRLQFSESRLVLKISSTHLFATVVLLKMHNISFSTADSFRINAPYFLLIYDYAEHQL